MVFQLGETMRVPYILLTAMAAASLCSCATAARADFPPTQLPPSVTVDDKLGIAVETAYQAAALAERTAVKAGFVSPDQARQLIALDNQAYTYVCYTRTAYDLANGRSPYARKDGCPLATKAGVIPTYVDAARTVITILRQMLGTMQAFHVARINPPPARDLPDLYITQQQESTPTHG
jgi:hypothetical protein